MSTTSTQLGDMQPEIEKEEVGRLEGLIVGVETFALSIAGFIGLWFLLLTAKALGNPRIPVLEYINYGIVAVAIFLTAVYLHSLWE